MPSSKQPPLREQRRSEHERERYQAGVQDNRGISSINFMVPASSPRGGGFEVWHTFRTRYASGPLSGQSQCACFLANSTACRRPSWQRTSSTHRQLYLELPLGWAAENGFCRASCTLRNRFSSACRMSSSSISDTMWNSSLICVLSS